MHLVSTLGEKIVGWAVENSLFSHIIMEIDNLIGTLARFLLKIVTPVQKNKVLFFTHSNRYDCNPKYICDELLARAESEKLDIVWAVGIDGDRRSIPDRCRTVRRNSKEFYKDVFSARIIVCNCLLYTKERYSLKKSKQVLIETWHGSLGIKRIGKKDNTAGLRWANAAVRTGHQTSYCISNSTFENRVYQETYWPNVPSLMYGHPRNDIFFPEYEGIRRSIRGKFLKTYRLPENLHFVLYAPTFRDSHSLDFYKIGTDQLRATLAKRFGGEWVFLFRLHPTMRRLGIHQSLYETDNRTVIDVTDYSDMQELLTIADVGITDYSSWIYDYVLLRRPGFIFATDVKSYVTERGFYYPLTSSPFPVAENAETLYQNILDFDDQNYDAKIDAFLADKGCVDDGKASKRTVDAILNILDDKAVE